MFNAGSLKGTITFCLYVFKNELISTLFRFPSLPPNVYAPATAAFETESHVEQAGLKFIM